MPPAILPAAITAGAGLVGGILGNRASGQAQDKQLAANEEAMAYEQEREAQRRQDWEQAMAQYTAGRNALLQRYGVPVPGMGGGGQFGAPAGPPPGAVPRGPAQYAPPMGAAPGGAPGASVPISAIAPGAVSRGATGRTYSGGMGPQRASRASRGAGLTLGELAMRRRA